MKYDEIVCLDRHNSSSMDICDYTGKLLSNLGFLHMVYFNTVLSHISSTVWITYCK
jgi:hypothetical protein